MSRWGEIRPELRHRSLLPVKMAIAGAMFWMGIKNRTYHYIFASNSEQKRILQVQKENIQTMILFQPSSWTGTIHLWQWKRDRWTELKHTTSGTWDPPSTSCLIVSLYKRAKSWLNPSDANIRLKDICVGGGHCRVMRLEQHCMREMMKLELIIRGRLLIVPIMITVKIRAMTTKKRPEKLQTSFN